jgi:hypothetical protein
MNDFDIDAALERIRADIAASAPEQAPRYAIAEWYYGNRRVTGDELATYERRNAERFAPAPPIDLTTERVKRTSGGFRSWTIHLGGEK